MKRPEEAIEAYSRAVDICPLYADCYFNMGNIYFEGDCSPSGEPDIDRALACHAKALVCLETTQDLDAADIPQSIITISRVCNMLGELHKRQESHQTAVTFYLKGISSDPLGNLDNYWDLAELYQSLGHSNMYLVIILFVKALTAIREGM